MARRALLITEGVHDVAFIGKLLKITFNLRRIQAKEDLDSGWQKFMSNFKWPLPPRKEDGKTDIARLSVPAPVFFSDEKLSIAISNAQGIDNMVHRADVDFVALKNDDTSLDAIGLLLDSDELEPAKRFDDLSLRIEKIGLPRPIALGQVIGKPRTGIFTMPNSTTRGTLEDLLIPCARTAYPELLKEAEALVKRRDEFLVSLNGKEKEEISAPCGPKKATAAIVGAFLKPGKPIQASIEDHRWLSPATLSLAELSSLLTFLKTLLNFNTGIEVVTSVSTGSS